MSTLLSTQCLAAQSFLNSLGLSNGYSTLPLSDCCSFKGVPSTLDLTLSQGVVVGCQSNVTVTFISIQAKGQMSCSWSAQAYSALESLSGVNYLSITGCDLSTLNLHDTTSALPNLKFLNLSNDQLQLPLQDFILSPQELSLVTLDLSNNQISGPVPSLSNLKNLKNLHLQNNNLAGLIPITLAALPLSSLFLQGNPLLLSPIPNLSSTPSGAASSVLNGSLFECNLGGICASDIQTIPAPCQLSTLQICPTLSTNGNSQGSGVINSSSTAPGVITGAICFLAVMAAVSLLAGLLLDTKSLRAGRFEYRETANRTRGRIPLLPLSLGRIDDEDERSDDTAALLPSPSDSSDDLVK